MINKVMVAVWDSQSECFGDPFFRPTRGVAVRDFMDAVNAEGSPFASHPDDFILYELGVMDVRTGYYDPHDKHADLGHARHFLNGVDK